MTETFEQYNKLVRDNIPDILDKGGFPMKSELQRMMKNSSRSFLRNSMKKLTNFEKIEVLANSLIF